VPWLPWKHCFKLYEFRTAAVPVDEAGTAKFRLERVLIRVRYEHALCLLGRKQGPIVHSLTLLPKEQVRIYEYDRYRRATSATERFSARTSFFTMTQRVNDTYSSTKAREGGSVSASTSVGGGGGGGVDLGIISFGAEASASASATTSAYFDVAQVSERFSHVAETSSLAVESERSIVVSTFEDQENLQSTARTLRNDNACQAVTYFIRRVFEVYNLCTRVVGIEVRIETSGWTSAPPQRNQTVVRRFLDRVDIGTAHDPRVEIALPTDGLCMRRNLHTAAPANVSMKRRHAWNWAVTAREPQPSTRSRQTPEATRRGGTRIVRGNLRLPARHGEWTGRTLAAHWRRYRPRAPCVQGPDERIAPCPDSR
jgi:thermitase